jgi:hypothetical protein
MPETDFYTEVARLASKDLDADPESFVPVRQSISREFIKTKLTGIIGYMLEHEFEKLCNTMYRLDVSEHKFREVLSGSNQEDIAGDIADLVIDREIQKVKTRQLYKKSKD